MRRLSDNIIVPAPKGPWASTSASKRLSNRRRQDTTPELRLRRALHAVGARYRLHVKVARRLWADIVFPRQKVAVFVDGCFWHGCPQHGTSEFRGPNASLWASKIARTQARDKWAVEVLSSEGWRVVRLWECQVTADPVACAERVLVLVRERRPSA